VPEATLVTFSKLQTPILRDQVTQAIRDAILTGDLKPGDKVDQRTLESQFGVSRIPIREGLRQLEEQGVVRTYPHRGTFVTQLSREDALDLMYIRIGLEQAALKLVWKRGRAPALVTELETLMSRKSAGIETEPSVQRLSVEINDAFHATIVKMADSPHLSRIWTAFDCFMLWTVSFLRMLQGPMDLNTLLDDIQEHVRVVQTFRQGDLDTALRTIDAHVQRGHAILIEQFPSREGLQDQSEPSR